ncbi:MAG: DNA helicase RecQ [Hyphomicrobiales bacterium]|nr:DNA helicase RecQ [Hyphomicrobiales bacterium]
MTAILPDFETAPKYKILKEIFGYDNFRPGQEPVIDALLEGSSALAVMPTGAGKSLCFQVPALVLGGMTIVVSPLVALMADQVAALKLAGVAAETINSSRTREENVESWHKVAAGQVPILYMAPERLMSERMLNAVAKLPVSLFAIDEAHCISRWGPAFRPEYGQLSTLADRFPNVPIAALTATADETTRQDIELQLFRGKSEIFITGFDRPNISILVESKNNWQRQLLKFATSRKGVNGIVYCLSRKKTEEAAAMLNANGIKALVYHAGLDKHIRAENQDRFVTESGLVIVATIAFGMGIDKSDVRYVFHTDLPSSIEAYYQEIGRAGRDGEPAEARMLFGPGDIALRRRFIDNDGGDEDNKRREHKRLDVFIAYADAISCRRQILLDYFGEKSEPCKNCDICNSPLDLSDGSEHAQLLMATILDTGQRFGQVHIIDVLRGAKTENIRKFNHQNCATYGEGSTFNKETWRSILRQMISSGLLKIDIAGYGGLHITDKGNEVSNGNEQFFYRKETLATKSKSSPKQKTVQSHIELSNRDELLLAELKKLRLQLAREKNVPAFVIFPDKTLIEMAAIRPSNVEQFAQIKGVGQAKLDKFAEVFLEVVRAG